jgi:tetratricopeptide (TPR) repeat protein
VNPDEVSRLHLTGRYAMALHEALREQTQAAQDGRRDDVVRWSVLAAQAARDMGRVAEALTHAQWAADTAASIGDPGLLCHARYGMAIALKAERDYDGALRELRAAIDELPAGTSDLIRATVLLEMSATCLDAGLRPEAEAALAKGGALVHWLREPRLLAWSLFLRSHFETISAADLQLSAAYEIARTVAFPELMWQILWRLGERAEEQGRDRMQEDCLWNAFRILTELAAPLEPADATAFWKLGARRTFLESIKTQFGPQFLKKVMAEGAPDVSNATRIIRDIGFDPNTIPDFVRRGGAQE